MSTLNRINILKTSLVSSRVQQCLAANGFIGCRNKVTSSSDRNYQYLKISEVPTQKFQKSLPKLGIPYVKKSIERYLDALEPIIADSKQYATTIRIANEFAADKDVDALQNKLIAIDKRNKHTSYISQPWFDMYLKSRLPLVLNYNPFMSWKDDPNPEYMPVPIRATNMLISAMRFRRSLIDNVLPPEVFFLLPHKAWSPTYTKWMKRVPDFAAFYASAAFQAYALDMSQFDSLFQLTRIPRKGRDELKKYPDSKHIAFLKSGQFFTFDVLDSNGDLRAPEDIFACVKYLSELKVDQSQDSKAVLSSEDRDVWAEAREVIVNTSLDNAASLEKVDSAQFLISFETNRDSEILDGAHNYLHGNSSKQGNRPLNRWFDKSFGILLDKQGHASITFEHSWGDGVAVLRAFNEIYEDSTKNHFIHPQSKPSATVDAAREVRHLPFKLNDSTKTSVANATKRWKDSTSRLDLNYIKYNRMSRDYLKMKRISPDSMFQLGFQMAFNKIYNYTAPTYESCSTSAFRHGRTEVVRSATRETKRACEAFKQKDKYSAEELRALLDACSKKHSLLTKDAALGGGFDRHLFMLKRMAEEEGKDFEFFKDPSYAYANQYVLSTSTLFGDYFSGGGFAPVIDDGFGLGYGYVDDQLGMLVSSFKGKRDGKQMTLAFAESLDEIYEVLRVAKTSVAVKKAN